jgi:NADH dehydrogenase
VLPSYPEKLSADAERSLIKLGVLPRTNVRVTAMDQDSVTLQSGERIETRTVLWAAGVAPSDFGKVLASAVSENGPAGALLNRQGQVIVAPDLTVPGHPEIFVIGDLAYFEQDGKAIPGVAPVAMQEGRYAAEVILDRLRGETRGPFHYHDKGSLAVIGRAAGVADLGRLKFGGMLAWLAWLFIHLMYLVQFRNRLIVFIRWGFQYVSFDRGARLITGDPE